MQLLEGHHNNEIEIEELFRQTFTTSEGAEEGRLVSTLAANLMRSTPTQDLLVFQALNKQQLHGAIMFSRMVFAEDKREVFLLSPVAVRTCEQGKGVGQKLVNFGLDILRQNGIDFVITYGDPKYYSKVGFEQISEEFANPPFRLQFPHGWQGQSLAGGDMVPLKGVSRCVTAFSDPALW